MTDEEMAEEYTAKNGFGSDCNNLTSYDANKEIEQAFLAGLKAGRPVWHYLTENPNDLPIGEVFYWFDENPNLKDGKVYGRSIGYYNPYEKEWHGYYKGCPCRIHNVIAWCEIPTFDKE